MTTRTCLKQVVVERKLVKNVMPPISPTVHMDRYILALHTSATYQRSMQSYILGHLKSVLYNIQRSCSNFQKYIKHVSIFYITTKNVNVSYGISCKRQTLLERSSWQGKHYPLLFLQGFDVFFLNRIYSNSILLTPLDIHNPGGNRFHFFFFLMLCVLSIIPQQQLKILLYVLPIRQFIPRITVMDMY